VLAGDRLERGATPIIADLPAAFIHEGLGLGFGPDGKLYASTGDALQAERAQQTDYLGGKFLRFNPDGTIPEDNPLPGSPVWSLGHRNPQGFAWRPESPRLLWATEHGSSFPIDGAGGQDEVNLIEKGANYGWPTYRGDETAAGFQAPIWNSGPEAVAPSGAAFCTGRKFPAWRNALLIATLRGASVFVVRFDPIDPTRIVSVERGLQGEFGRLRAVQEAPDGYIYLTTSNRDDRGTPGLSDDRILRLIPAEE
jgi:glucose/arabinose dehydrogenase